MSNADKLFEFLKEEPYGRRLRICLDISGIQAVELARAIGVVDKTAHIWCNNKRKMPSPEHRKQIREYICAEMPWLYELLVEEGDEE